MKLFTFDSTGHSALDEILKYDVVRTARDLGFTHVMDTNPGLCFLYDEKPVRMKYALELYEPEGFTDSWEWLDEASKVDLGEPHFMHSTMPVEIVAMYENNPKVHPFVNLINAIRNLPTHAVLYYDEPYVCILVKIDLTNDKAVCQHMHFVN